MRKLCFVKEGPGNTLSAVAISSEAPPAKCGTRIVVYLYESIQTGTGATASCAATVRQRGRRRAGLRVSAGDCLCHNGNGQPSTFRVRLEEYELAQLAV